MSVVPDPLERALHDGDRLLDPYAFADPAEGIAGPLVRTGGSVWERGARVVLRPRGHADSLDQVLAGRIATVQSVEQDLEGRVYLAVTVDDDPGRDLGERGHRYFFGPDEVEGPAGTREPGIEGP